MPISREAILNSASSIVGKPVLFKYSSRSEDFLQHEEDELACGVIALDKSDYSFKEDEEGKLWLVARAYIWKLYYPEVAEVFARDEEKAISMEIFIVDSEVEEDEETQAINLMSFTGVTLLGEIYEPAIANAKAVVEKFSELVKETKKLVKIKSFKKENSTDKKEGEDVSEKDFKKAEFAKSYDYTVNEIMEKFQEQINDITYSESGYTSIKYRCRDFCKNYVYMSDYESGKIAAVPYSKDLKLDMANIKSCSMRYVVEEEQEESETVINLIFSKEEFSLKIKEIQENASQIEAEKQTNIDNLTSEVSKFSEQIKSHEDKISKLEAEKEDLSKFKSNILKQERDQQIRFALDSVNEVLNKDQLDEWAKKADDFENADSFKNAIQAFAFTISNKIDSKDKIKKIHIPLDSADEHGIKKGLWD